MLQVVVSTGLYRAPHHRENTTAGLGSAGPGGCPDGVKSRLLSGAGGRRTDGVNFLLVRGVRDLQSG